MATFPILVLFLLSLPLLYILTKSSNSRQRLPPGSLGIPFIGDSLGLLRAMWTNRSEEWLARRIDKYGPISKLTLFGAPTIFLAGPAANKLIFTHQAVVPQQPKSITRIIGKRNMLELIGEDHKRVRGAVSQFLRPELLKQYVGHVDEEVRYHLEKNWIGRRSVKRGPLQEDLKKDFVNMIVGMWAVPVNLPFTGFNKSLKASSSARKVLARIVHERKAALEQGRCASREDLITYLIGTGLSDEEIVDNAVLVMIAGYDTSSHLITLIVRHLANDNVTRAQLAQEHAEIAKGKAPGERLTWDDLSRMKCTWRVAMEILRMIPPLVGSFRKPLKDLEFNGYVIPKGWQVFWATSVTQMDPNIFPDPEKFNPNRFENLTSAPPYCYIPFGGGPRICPGSEFARMETLVMMHHLLTKFEWKLCCKDDTLRRDPMPSPREGLPIQIEPKISL